jgi:tRNA A-37 threonylcarbamoyl transferase component Bud32
MNTNISPFFKNKKLEKKVLETVSTNKGEVIKLDYKKGKKRVWIKRGRESKSNLLHKSAYFITRIKGLMPVEAKTKEKALKHEVEKLQKLRELGIRVPKVLGCKDDYFVLEDTGITLKEYLKNPDIDSETLHKTLMKCVKLLAKIHNASFYHAGPQIKNYTIKNNKIYAIDFEDSFDDKYDLKELQFRDFFLFLVSLTEVNKEIDYRKIIEVYKRKTNNQTIDQELKSIALKLNFLVKLVEFKPLQKYLDDDVMYNYKLFKILQEL